MIMNRLQLIFEQTMLVSFMVLCYISVYGLLALSGKGQGFDWYIPGSVVLASFLCSLVTVLLLYTAAENKDESPVNYYIRVILHFVLLYGLIMGFGYLFYWYRGRVGFILTSLIYVLIYAGAWIGTLILFRRDEKLISDALDKIRDEE
jgi:hypothetical protein